MASEDDEAKSNASCEPEIKEEVYYETAAGPSSEDLMRIESIKQAFKKAAIAEFDQDKELEIARERLLESSTVFESIIRVGLHFYYPFFHQCCYEGSVVNLEKLAQYPFKESARSCVNNFDSNGLAPIHYAAKYNKYSCLKMLVETFGADVLLDDEKLKRSTLSHCAKSHDKKVGAVAVSSVEETITSAGITASEGIRLA
ncbi:hypothetical protein Ciccas_009548 [Cichlidogyrus casuarinus]|uniref:Uncharacterized protein n=1 Tax=Cichlidogyrus casuarinus TaxID=1844966 RepID=A0ABD2PWQ3_9PLAT